MVSMSLYICQNSKNVQHLKVTPSVNSGLWLIIMCQCQFIFCNKCTTLVGDVDDGGGCACVGQGVYEKSLYLPLNVAVNLKLKKKKKKRLLRK